MEIYLCIFRLLSAPLLLLEMSIDEYDTKHGIVSSSMTLCTVKGWISFFDDVLLTKKWSLFQMTFRLENVAVICLGWKQPKRFFTQDNFVPR
jgi:hypothetical protein